MLSGHDLRLVTGRSNMFSTIAANRCIIQPRPPTRPVSYTEKLLQQHVLVVQKTTGKIPWTQDHLLLRPKRSHASWTFIANNMEIDNLYVTNVLEHFVSDIRSMLIELIGSSILRNPQIFRNRSTYSGTLWMVSSVSNNLTPDLRCGLDCAFGAKWSDTTYRWSVGRFKLAQRWSKDLRYLISWGTNATYLLPLGSKDLIMYVLCACSGLRIVHSHGNWGLNILHGLLRII